MLFKTLAKAALRFAPIDYTSTQFQLLVQKLAGLEHAIGLGRWDLQPHPPLRITVTFINFEPLERISNELTPKRLRATHVIGALAPINEKFGNNTKYFGAMQTAVGLDAAPMRIPFQTILITREQKTS